MEKAIPDIKLILESEAIAGVSSKKVHILGTYKQKGSITTIQLKAVKDLIDAELLAQIAVDYETQRSGDQALVAVLDLESDTLSLSQRKSFSEVFRSAIARSGHFNLASSAEIDKMDPDQIQRSTGCTRDECAPSSGSSWVWIG